MNVNSPHFRPAIQAGRFYPGRAVELRAEVERLLAEARPPTAPTPKAIIAPHAGYPYSGPIAASAFRQWEPDRHRIERVILIGPSHHAAFPGVAVSGLDAFATPLGLVPVDRTAVQLLTRIPGLVVDDAPHGPEHCLEVQLPFLQVVLDRFAIVPLLVGDAAAETVGRILQKVWGGPETRILVSSDLSHYHDAATARALDAVTAEAIESLQGDRLDGNDACGFVGIRGLLWLARRHGLRCEVLDLRNSGDTAGHPARVVGYGAFAWREVAFATS